MENVKIVDVSRYNGDIDWKKMVGQGVKGVIIRATVGNYYTDFRLFPHYEGARSVGLLVGFYHVVVPGIAAGSQLQRFYDATDNLDYDFPPVLDVELHRNQSSAEITKNVFEHVILIEKKLDRYPIIYTRQSFWDHYVAQNDIWGKCPLWAARYSDNLESPWSDGYFKFRDWDEWTMWQWSETGDGEEYGQNPSQSKAIDLNWFNGTYADLLAFLEQDEDDGEIKPDDDVPRKIEITAPYGLNIRTSPNVSQTNDVGGLSRGTVLEVVDSADSNGDVWYAVKLWVAAKYKGKTLVKPHDS